MILFTAINNDPIYKNNLRVLLQSLAEFSPDTDNFIVHAFNCSERFIRECRIINPKVKIVPQRYDVSKDRFGKEWADNGKSYFMEAYRFEFFREWLSYHNEGWIGWVDADVMVRKPLGPLWEDVGPNTLKIWRRMTVDNPATIMNIGVMLLGASQESRKFIDDLIELNGDNPFWGHSQKATWESYLKNQDKIQHVQLDPLVWNCRTFESCAAIWHPTINCIDDPVYKTEFNRMLGAAQEKFLAERLSWSAKML